MNETERKEFERVIERVDALERALSATLTLLLTALPDLDNTDRGTLLACRTLVDE